jgi:mannose-6-phosphate isomerase-like protein (cupin superfamily)
MLDSPESVCAGQIGFEYPATFVPFSKLTSPHLMPRDNVLQVLRAARQCGFQVVAGRPDGLQRLMVVSGRLPADTGGGPVRAHLGDEVLRIISGEIIVRVGPERRICGAGDVAVVPANVLHGFQVVQDTLMEAVADKTSARCSPSANPTGAGNWWRCIEPTFPGARRHPARPIHYR